MPALMRIGSVDVRLGEGQEENLMDYSLSKAPPTMETVEEVMLLFESGGQVGEEAYACLLFVVGCRSCFQYYSCCSCWHCCSCCLVVVVVETVESQGNFVSFVCAIVVVVAGVCVTVGVLMSCASYAVLLMPPHRCCPKPRVTPTSEECVGQRGKMYVLSGFVVQRKANPPRPVDWPTKSTGK